MSILKRIVILLVPCLVLAQIRVEVKTQQSSRKIGVITRGHSCVFGSDIDLSAFELTPDRVKENLEAKMGYSRVGNIHVADANDFDGKLKKLNVTLRIKSVNLLLDDHSVKTVGKLKNSQIPRKIVRGFNETVRTEWFGTSKLNFTSSIHHIISELGDVTTFGTNHSVSKVFNIEWKPKVLQSRKFVALRLKKKTLQIRINYEVHLAGDIYVEYDVCENTIFDYTCWDATSLDVNQYFKMVGQPAVRPYEIVTYTTYFDPKVKFRKVKKKQEPQVIFEDIIYWYKW